MIYLEHRVLYRREKEDLPDGELLTPLGRARVAREGRDVTILTYGWTVHEALDAAAEAAKEGVAVEVIDLRTLVPLDEETVFASVKKIGKVVVVHEATATAGYGAELVARIADRCFEHLDGPVLRVTYPDRPSPYNKGLEKELIPGKAKILDAVRRLARY